MANLFVAFVEIMTSSAFWVGVIAGMMGDLQLRAARFRSTPHLIT
jgi:hypothetical protein